MSKILIVYGTTEGQAGKIAGRIRDQLLEAGHIVDLYASQEIPNKVDPKNFDGVIVGASVHVGGYQNHLKKWVKAHSLELNAVPSAFFSVCLAVLQNDPKALQESEDNIQKFITSTGWQPTSKMMFAGGLAYSKDNPLVKWWMKRIAKKMGGDTDTSKDFEYTDWLAVGQFATAFARQLDVPSDSDLVVKSRIVADKYQQSMSSSPVSV